MNYSEILITGKTGTVGSNLSIGVGYSSKEYDLRNKNSVDKLLDKECPKGIIHCAATVGGLKFHMNEKYKLFYDNILMNTNIIECARERKITRILSFLSSCIFSEKSKQPYNESQVHEYEPFSVHYPYGFSKRLLDIHSRICYEQFGLIYNCVIPTNIYGINDDFNFDRGHVVGVLIRKAFEASKNNENFVVWGDGEQERDFLFTEDVAKLTEWAFFNYLDKEPLIFSNKIQIKIGYIAKIIAKKFNIENKLVFDTSKPSGQKNRSLDNNKLINIIDFKFTTIEDGLDKTIDWFVKNYPNVRL